MRLQTIGYLNLHGYPIVLYEDPWYSIRQIEQIVHNFPSFAWFDPFLNFPAGKDIFWGPIFPVSAALFSLLFGAVTQSEIIQVVSWIPPLVLIPMIPVCYIIGKNIWNKKAGFLAAILVCFVSGEFLFRTQYGYVDHHCFETLFFFAFIAFYLLTIKNSLQKSGSTLISKNGVIFALISGVCFYLGILNMPTMLISGVIISIFTLIYSLFSESRKDLFRLGQIHTIIFGFFTLLYTIYGFHYPGLALQGYSFGLVLAAFLIILGTWYLYMLWYVTQKIKYSKNAYYSLIGASIALFILIINFNSFLSSLIINNLGIILSDAFSSSYISELKPISISAALSQYNIGLILSIIGVFILLKKYKDENAPAVLLILVSSIIITYISFNQIRYQYYEGPIIVLLSAITLERVFFILSKRISPSSIDEKKTSSANKNFKSLVIKKSPFLMIGVIITVFIILSSQVTISYLVIVPENSVTEEKVQSLLWLKENSLAPGINYTTIYEKEGFQYPDNSYTILTWWGDGHQVTALSQRMPMATPLQDMGAHASTEFYLAENESFAEEIIRIYKPNYVIVDIDLYSLYPQIKAWVNNPQIKKDQVKILYSLPEKSGSISHEWFGMTDSFFESMFVRLYQFDGSVITAEEKNNFTYIDMPYGNSLRSVVIPDEKIGTISAIEGTENLKQNIEVSFNSTRSTIDLPALTEYRLIYESPKIAPNFRDKEIHNIKIFEHVKGHTIPGTGTIELPLITNQGREFIYRQQSVNNTFTLPYSTTNTPYDVHATGPYRIIETNDIIDVDESQIERYYK